MIDKTNINKIFKELDLTLKEKGRKEELFIFGSAALISLGIKVGDRTTQDVDVFRPTFDKEMSAIVAAAGKKFNLQTKWLNTGGRVFLKDFRENWEDRTVEVFKGESLVIHSLGRADLICTKLDALCDRSTTNDKIDLMSLEPNKKELEDAINWIVSKNLHTEELVRTLSDEILEKMKKRSRGFER